MKRVFLCALFCALLACSPALAREGEATYEMRNETGEKIMRLAGRIYEGDEYISGDNTLYRVVAVDDRARIATAENLGPEPFDAAAFARADSDKKPLVCIYHTHSDESYIPGDGSESKTKNAGIYDVGDALAKALETKGFSVEHSEDTFLPHDAKAYERSRRTAKDMAEETPAAIFDVHRDGIPDADEYKTTVDGDKTSMVRLLVGRANQNSDVNRAFAKKLKAAADSRYPGLVKDIFIGKGNYNQELYPNSVLLEFGTHTLDKDRAVSATEYMADVIASVLKEDTAKAAPASGEKAPEKGAARGTVWLALVALLAAGLYALISSGSLRKMKTGFREMTGGIFGGRRK